MAQKHLGKHSRHFCRGRPGGVSAGVHRQGVASDRPGSESFPQLPRRGAAVAADVSALGFSSSSRGVRLVEERAAENGAVCSRQNRSGTGALVYVGTWVV